MDRSSRRYCCSVLILSFVLLLAACSSTTPPDSHSQPLEDKKIDAPFTCYGGNDGGVCAGIGGALLALQLINVPAVGGSAQERRHNAHAIFGRCEFAGNPPKPCDGVLLTIKAPGYLRKAWITGFDFEVTGIKGSKVDIDAFSDDYGVRTAMRDVKPGSHIKIQLKLPAK